VIMMNDTPEKLPVPAIGKAFAILEYLSGSSTPHTLQDIYCALKLPRTTVFSLLGSLQACGAVTKLESGGYMPGIRLYCVGMSARISLENNRLIVPRLERLRDEIGHTVFFSLFDDGEQVVWEKVEGFESVYFKAYPGQRKRLNTSSAGKAIAAYLTDAEIQYSLSKGMDHSTEKSITDPALFLRHLEDVRAKGYAVDDEEGEIGIYCIGVPVFSGNGHVFGAVSMSMLKSRVHFSDFDRYIMSLKMAAGDISTML